MLEKNTQALQDKQPLFVDVQQQQKYMRNHAI
jgi:hypothetical protein